MSLKLEQKSFLLVGFVLATEVLFVVVLGSMLKDAQHNIEQERHSRAVITQLDQLALAIQKASMAMVTVGDPALKSDELAEADENYEKQRAQIPIEVEKLKRLTAKDTSEAQEIKELDTIVVGGCYLMEQCSQACRKSPSDSKQILQYKFFLSDKAREFALINDHIMADYQHMLEAGFDADKRLRSIGTALIVALIANIVMVVVLAVLFTRSVSKRLATLSQNSIRVAAGEPLTEPLSGSDEIASVDSMFRRMAESLAISRKHERAVIDNALDMICSINEQDTFTAVNPAAQTLIHYTEAELIGRRFIDIVALRSRDEMRSRMQEARRDNKDGHFETVLVRKDHTEVEVRMAAHWSAEERSVFCVIHDITERKRAERLKQEFVAMVSHDLRTPLTSIMAVLHMINERVFDPLSDTGRKRIESAQADGKRLLQLVNDLLDLEKLESGNLDLDMDLVNVADVAHSSLQSVAAFAEQQSVALHTDVQPLEVMGSEERLIQVVINLLSNAVKFSPEGTTVYLRAVAKDGYCKLSVQDSGPGIPKEQVYLLFQRFQQLPGGTGNQLQGSGLGLAICKAIVEAQKGNICYEPANGKGSIFSVMLPLAHADDDLG